MKVNFLGQEEVTYKMSKSLSIVEFYIFQDPLYITS